ncbi:MAG: TRAP transporter large permease subunit [Hyphomicrobiaceae bacterium]
MTSPVEGPKSTLVEGQSTTASDENGSEASAHPISRGLNRIVTTIGHIVMWANVILVVAIIIQVSLRRILNQNYPMLDELQWHLYGLAAMIGLSYVLVKNSHIRVDIIHTNLSDYAKSIIEIGGIVLFVFPFLYLMIDQGWDYFYESWRVNERSTSPVGLPARWALKLMIPVSFFLIALAATARLIDSIYLLMQSRVAPAKDGRSAWPLLVVFVTFIVALLVFTPMVETTEHKLVIAMFLSFIALLFLGFPVAWTLAGIGVIFCWLAYLFDSGAMAWTGLDQTLTGLHYLPLGLVINRVYAVAANPVLVALPMFIFMGLMLDESGIAVRLMKSMQRLFGTVRGGLAITVAVIGIILAASTGIIGASVVLLGALSLPVMMQQGYSKAIGTGTIAASGTLGILIPPSIMLVIMADQMALSVGDLFMAAVIPGLIIGTLYILYIIISGLLVPSAVPVPEGAKTPDWTVVKEVFVAVLPPVFLMLAVLGSIFAGLATPTEASGVGAFGAALLAAAYGKLSFSKLVTVSKSTLTTTGYIIAIFVGAVCFSYVLRELGGDELIEEMVRSTGLGATGTIMFILLVVFLLGFVLDWIEITLIVLPLMRPIINGLDLGVNGFDVVEEPTLIWFVIMVAVTLQTSFLTPPVGFALFYLKGVCPPEISLKDIYKGVVPFVLLQILGLCLVFLFPQLTTWLPSLAFE